MFSSRPIHYGPVDCPEKPTYIKPTADARGCGTSGARRVIFSYECTRLLRSPGASASVTSRVMDGTSAGTEAFDVTHRREATLPSVAPPLSSIGDERRARGAGQWARGGAD